MPARRILLDLLAASTGGQLTRARAFLSRLRQYDRESELWILQERGSLGAMIDRPDLKVIDLYPPRGPRSAYRAIWQNLRLPALAWREHFDVYLTFSHFLPWTLPRRIRTIVGVGNLAPFSAEALEAESRWSRRMRLRLLRKTILSSAKRSDRVIALSETCRNVLTANGIDARKIRVISNGVEPPAADPGLRSQAATDALLRGAGIVGPFVLYVSHFYPYKNFVRLVDAFARLPAALRERHQLVLVGEPHDRQYYASVVAAVRAHALEKRVLLIPGLNSPSLGMMYQATDLFVYPSLVENSPNILLEAMTHGAAVLAGSHQPMPEFGGDAIAYFDALSTDSIASELISLLTDPDRRAALRERAPHRASRYTWDAFTRDVVSLYRDTGPQTTSCDRPRP